MDRLQNVLGLNRFATLQIGEGAVFVSLDGGNAYLWRYDGRRVELLGATQVVEGADEQTAFVWSPAVERRN